ncbi:MAG TPA: GHMP kinase [bacterium]|nr:GHMP kinase [bacterium]
MKIFVPGRICLFGEHSDWAGGYRRINSEIEKGYTIITGTNQGIYAEVKPHPNKLILHASLEDGTRKGPYEIPMKREVLLSEAQKGGFFSYVAGVAYEVLTHYRVNGLEIDNYFTDLPVKKGLSSSAAICVLVARAFNRLYNLKMTVRGEMEYAYRGEITTPSRCGRMDQGCAYGNRPILMVFDGDRIDIRELKVTNDFFFVIVDLNASKDTKEILGKLNSCYPFAENDMHNNVQKYLGPINAQITQDASRALQKGDFRRLGELMKNAQYEFDLHLKPACPSQLTAPILHKVLNYEPIQPYVLGGKGVGSQGDGSAQFLVKDEESQDKVIRIIEKNLNMNCMKLTIKSTQKIRKAIIPAAGFGTRLFPSTKAVKKEFFPIIDHDGRVKPAILSIVEEALNAGVEEIGIIVQDKDIPIFEEFFKMPPSIENFNRLSKDDQKYCEYLTDIGNRISFILQDVQEGFGHAVYSAREWVNDEPFLLLLGDHLYKSNDDVSCSRQLLNVYDRFNQNTVGLSIISADEINNFGCVTGMWEQENKILNISEITEKPKLDYAREHLSIEGMDDNSFLGLFGQYILKPKIFEYLEENIKLNHREAGEFQLTSCIERLRQEDGLIGYVIEGKRFDIGNPESYREVIDNY